MTQAYLPLLITLSYILEKDLDRLCSARAIYRRHLPATENGTRPLQPDPYTPVIDRLERALANTDENIACLTIS
jgi:hypothetical protein